jgi:DNA (cytosine-5)-methyltransferase 1
MSLKKTPTTGKSANPQVPGKKASTIRKLGVVSLYAGAGGLDIAACRTGMVEAIVSTDANATFLSTIEQNLPAHFPEIRHATIVEDGRTVEGSVLKKLLGESTPDIVMGGPPCDDYTKYGLRRGFEGDKGPLIFEFLRVVEEIKPECFVFENVPNLAQQFRGVFERFLERVEKIGYHSKCSILKACDYGSPTLRSRVFVVGWNNASKNKDFHFPEPTHGDPVKFELMVKPLGHLERFCMVKDVLEGLPDVHLEGHPTFENHTGRKHKQSTIDHMASVPLGKNVKKSFRYRSPWDGLCQSLTAGVDYSTKSYIHPIYPREMSVREYARIHQFPDKWIFSGNHHNGIKQVANSVPIALGSAVIKEIFNNILK